MPLREWLSLTTISEFRMPRLSASSENQKLGAIEKADKITPVPISELPKLRLASAPRLSL